MAIDFVQRESHRHAHWLLPAVHWLERDDLLAFTSNMHDEPYVQYGSKAVEPPPGARQEWRIFIDLAIAMRKPLFRRKGVNAFIGATRRIARTDAQARDWSSARTGSTDWWWPPARKFNGRRIKWRDVIGPPARLGAGPARVRTLQGGAADRRQEGARRAAGVPRTCA